MPSNEQRDLRILLRHRHQWVRMRSRVQYTLQSMALANDLRRGHSLWSQAGQHELQALQLAPHASQRRTALLTLYPRFQESIDDLNRQVSEMAIFRSSNVKRCLSFPTGHWRRRTGPRGIQRVVLTQLASSAYVKLFVSWNRSTIGCLPTLNGGGLRCLDAPTYTGEVCLTRARRSYRQASAQHSVLVVYLQ
jgi:hypothetical protein